MQLNKSSTENLNSMYNQAQVEFKDQMIDIQSVSNFGLNPQFKREGKKSQTRTPENLSTIPHKNNDTPFSRISDKS